MKSARRDYRLAPKTQAGPSGQERAYSINLQPMQAIDALLNYFFIRPAHQQESGCAVQEIVLSRSLPNEVPWIFRVNAHNAATVSVNGFERAGKTFGEITLTKIYGI